MNKQSLTEYIKNLETTNPSQGLYLKLSHGRKTPDEDLSDWGSDGPSFGPLKWCHITYLSSLNICALNDDSDCGSGPMQSGDPLHFHKEFVVYEGIYYGDFDVGLVG